MKISKGTKIGIAIIAILEVLIILFICNAIYINRSIPTLDGWYKVSTGGISCGFVSRNDCYHNNNDFVCSIGGKPLKNLFHRHYTPLSSWYGFETASYEDLAYHYIYTLYKHNSIIPFWSDYLIICND